MSNVSVNNPVGLKAGDTVKLTGPAWDRIHNLKGACVRVESIHLDGTPTFIHNDYGTRYYLHSFLGDRYAFEVVHRAEAAEQLEPEFDPVNSPNYYVMPDGSETVGISKWLTSAGGQAVQYIVRATRTDGIVKENPIEDLEKAMFWLQVELDRVREAAA